MRVFWQYERLEPHFESTTGVAGEASALLASAPLPDSAGLISDFVTPSFALSDFAWSGAVLVPGEASTLLAFTPLPDSAGLISDFVIPGAALSDVAWSGAVLVSDGVFGLGRTRRFILCRAELWPCCTEQIVQQISGAHSM